jgi:predicted glycogen debranching enzyme
LPNGVGGYASSTVLGCPTRRYHGLLVTRPPRSARRHVFLARFEEHVRHAGGTVPLSVARYADCFAPEGWRALERFELAPFPAASYTVGAATVTRQVLCVEGAPTVLCRWQLHGGDETVELELRPLVPAREADALTIENPALDPTVERVSGGLRVRPYGVLPALTLSLAADAWSFDDDSVWFRGISYPADAERGYPEREDNWSPGALRVTLAPGAEVVVAATIGAAVSDPAALWRGESAARRSAAASALRAHPRAAARLELAADDFLYRADVGAGGIGRLGVDAGFPWFGEWGRDTFVSLPG